MHPRKICAVPTWNYTAAMKLLPSLQTQQPRRSRHRREHAYATLTAMWIIIRQVLSSEIPSLLNLGYDYLIFDMGSLNEADIPEFLRCDRKLVYGSLASWKAPHYEAFFQQYDTYTNLGEGFCYLLQTGVNKTLSQFSKKHHIHLCTVPFINHPFHISRDLFPFFTTILSAGDRTYSISRIL